MRLEVIINKAVVLANKLKHEYLTNELVFKCTLEDETVRKIISDCGGDVVKLEAIILIK